MSPRWVEVPILSIVRRTEKAILVEMFSAENTWLPLSQIHPDDRDEDWLSDIRVTAWIAREKDLT